MAIASINDIVREICAEMMKVHGVKAFAGGHDILHHQHTRVAWEQPAEDDPDGFITDEDPKTLRIPVGLGGRYFIHAKVRWMTQSDGPNWSKKHSHAGFFWVYLTKNNVTAPPLQSSRAKNAAVPHAKKTTQQIVWEGDLAENDTIELYAWQTVVKDSDTFMDGSDDPDPANAIETDVMVDLQCTLTIRRLGVRA